MGKRKMCTNFYSSESLSNRDSQTYSSSQSASNSELSSLCRLFSDKRLKCTDSQCSDNPDQNNKVGLDNALRIEVNKINGSIKDMSLDIKFNDSNENLSKSDEIPHKDINQDQNYSLNALKEMSPDTFKTYLLSDCNIDFFNEDTLKKDAQLTSTSPTSNKNTENSECTVIFNSSFSSKSLRDEKDVESELSKQDLTVTFLSTDNTSKEISSESSEHLELCSLKNYAHSTYTSSTSSSGLKTPTKIVCTKNSPSQYTVVFNSSKSVKEEDVVSKQDVTVTFLSTSNTTSEKCLGSSESSVLNQTVNLSFEKKGLLNTVSNHMNYEKFNLDSSTSEIRPDSVNRFNAYNTSDRIISLDSTNSTMEESASNINTGSNTQSDNKSDESLVLFKSINKECVNADMQADFNSLSNISTFQTQLSSNLLMIETTKELQNTDLVIGEDCFTGFTRSESLENVLALNSIDKTQQLLKAKTVYLTQIELRNPVTNGNNTDDINSVNVFDVTSDLIIDNVKKSTCCITASNINYTGFNTQSGVSKSNENSVLSSSTNKKFALPIKPNSSVLMSEITKEPQNTNITIGENCFTAVNYLATTDINNENLTITENQNVSSNGIPLEDVLILNCPYEIEQLLYEHTTYSNIDDSNIIVNHNKSGNSVFFVNDNNSDFQISPVQNETTVYETILNDIVAENQNMEHNFESTNRSFNSTEVLSTGSNNNFNEIQKRIRTGINRICMDKSLRYKGPITSYEINIDVKNRTLKSKILHTFYRILKQATNDQPILLLVRNNLEWDNCTFENNILQLKKCHNMKYKIIKPQNGSTFNVIVYLLGKIYAMINNRTICTQREVYYLIKKYLSRQVQISNCINTISCMLNVEPWYFPIVSTSKGFVYGPLTVVTSDGDIINCTTFGGTTIPQNVIKITKVITKAHFIMVVEKDAIFKKMIVEDTPNKFTRPYIMITGKGCPDINTRLFIRVLRQHLKIPIFILVDADPYGVDIMLTYRYGSLTMSHLNDHLAEPGMQWLGILPSEIISLGINHLPLQKRDKNVIMQMFKRPYMNKNYRIKEELNVLLHNNFKAEIEGIEKSNNYLTDFYLPNKLCSNDYF